MKRIALAIAILISIPNISYGNEDKIDEVVRGIDAIILQKYLEKLVSFGSRVTGSIACNETARYIYHEFQNMGLQACYHNWSSRNGMKIYHGQNIVATISGDEKIIIFNAHFDSVENTVGADDNAAGVAALLAIAKVMSNYKFRHTIKFVAFSGEEEGLLGSMEYAKMLYQKNADIVVEFNADMIGHAGDMEGEKKFRIYATEDADWIVRKIEEMNDKYTHFYLHKGNLSRTFGASDYFSFTKYGYEAIAFFEYEWNPYMHTPMDNLSNVNLKYLVNTTRLIAASLAYLGDCEVEKPFLVISSPIRGKIYVGEREMATIHGSYTIVIGDCRISALTDGNVVEFYIDNKLIHTATSPPFTIDASRLSFWKHEIKAIAYSNGEKSRDAVEIWWFDRN